jgi:2-amino-4-hydroxy-6-hydroxymethyldihydropteridine diphosphokinase
MPPREREGGGGTGALGAGGAAAAAPPRPLRYSYYLGVGSNLGDRFRNLREAAAMLEEEDDEEGASPAASAAAAGAKAAATRVVRTSFLYESAPMYDSSQPPFLNAALLVASGLDPPSLLRRLKRIETRLGRVTDPSSPLYARNGPRTVDLDILLAGVEREGEDEEEPVVLDPSRREGGERGGGPPGAAPDLVVIPHPRIAERPFVLGPLLDLAGPRLRHPTLGATIAQLSERLLLDRCGGEEEDGGGGGNEALVRVLPLPRGRLLYLNQTLVMGILNATPDSFSGDGQYRRAGAEDEASAAAAVARGLQLVGDGARILDVGGESTRPGAQPVDPEEERDRVVPVVRGIRQIGACPFAGPFVAVVVFSCVARAPSRARPRLRFLTSPAPPHLSSQTPTWRSRSTRGARSSPGPPSRPGPT